MRREEQRDHEINAQAFMSGVSPDWHCAMRREEQRDHEINDKPETR